LGCHWKRRWRTDAKRRDAFVDTAPKDATFAEGDSPDDIGNDTEKPTATIGTTIIMLMPKDAICSIGERRIAFEHEAGKPTPFVATFPQDDIYGTN
jgi:hypothetical protein